MYTLYSKVHVKYKYNTNHQPSLKPKAQIKNNTLRATFTYLYYV